MTAATKTNMRPQNKFMTLIIVIICVFTCYINLYASQELKIGESTNIYLNPSIPSSGWITSASWSTDVIGLNCSNSGEWGTMVTANGYWDDLATLSCLYTYSYYGADNKVHVNHGYEYYYFTCKGYPISLSSSSINLNVGETTSLSFSISGATIGEIPARWISSDENVATVYRTNNYTATVQAKSPGFCTITCYSYMGKPVVCSVQVNSVEPTSFKISPSEATVTVDKTISLECVFTPSYASSNITWESMKPSIATVSNGKVTGKKAGKTTITATTTNGLSARCTITVTDKYSNPRGPVSISLDGSGTSLNPFKINSASDLRYLADKVCSGTDFAGKYFRQTADITINPSDKDREEFKNGEIWIPIGDGKHPFRGNYDGGNYAISGIFISNETEYEDVEELNGPFGLFGYIDNAAKISNLKVDNVLIIAEKLVTVGGIIAGSGKDVTIKNCHLSNASLTSDKLAAGITTFGEEAGGIIDECSSNANIKCRFRGSCAAGICASTGNCQTIITNCINSGDISASLPAGIASNSGDIYNCCNSGNIKSFNENISGGIMYEHSKIGTSNTVTIENCLNYGEISSSNKNTCGAILGRLWSGGAYCYNNVYENSIKLEGTINYSGWDFLYQDNSQSYSLEELKTSSIISKLNSNLKAGWSRWVNGKDGYPTLDYYLEMAEINNITIDENLENFDVYNLQGILLLHNATQDDIMKLKPDIYIIGGKKILLK